MPKKGDIVTIVPENTTTDDGIQITDELVIYNQKGQAIAHIRETDFSAGEVPRKF